MAGFTQVHVTGIPPDADEDAIDATFLTILVDREEMGWCDTRVMRDKDSGVCRGYCFLSFFSKAQAEAAINVLNDSGIHMAESPLAAQLSVAKKQGNSKPKGGQEDLPDLQRRRKTHPSQPKHPVGRRHCCSDKGRIQLQQSGKIIPLQATAKVGQQSRGARTGVDRLTGLE
jgi:RNA recognition motif-containing protein